MTVRVKKQLPLPYSNAIGQEIILNSGLTKRQEFHIYTAS